MLVRASTFFMGVEDQNIALARFKAFLMSRASTFLMGEKREGKKQPMSRASTFFMGEKKTQKSLPEFFVPAHIPALLDASLMRVRP